MRTFCASRECRCFSRHQAIETSWRTCPPSWNLFGSKVILWWFRSAEEKLFKVANCKVRTDRSPSPITRISDASIESPKQCNNNSLKMPPASSPPPLSSWAPILFPPWNSGLLPAAFYPAALRSLPTWVHLDGFWGNTSSSWPEISSRCSNWFISKTNKFRDFPLSFLCLA